MIKEEFIPVKNPNKLSSYLKKEWKVLLIVALTGTIFNYLMPYISILQGRIIDTAISKSSNDLISECAFFIVIVLFIQSMRFLKRYTVRVFANKTLLNMRSMMYNSIMQKDINEISKEKTGDLIVKAVSDVDYCAEGLRKIITEIFDTGILMLSYIIQLFKMDFKITLYSSIFIPVAMLCARLLKEKVTKVTADSRKENSRVSQMKFDLFNNISSYRISSSEEIFEKQYDESLKKLEKANVRADLLSGALQPLYQMLSMIGIIFIFIFGSKLVISSLWTIGQFIAYLSMFTALALKSSKASNLWNSYYRAKVSWKRIEGYFKDYKIYQNSSPSIIKEVLLEANNLSYRFSNTTDYIFKGINFKAQNGDLIAISGKVASGKSIILKIIQGILKDYEGSLKINGTEIKEMSEEEINDLSVAQFDKSFLIKDKIKNNIALDDDLETKNNKQSEDEIKVKEKKIEESLSFSDLSKDLKIMKKDEELMTGPEGSRLSGGQKARLSLSRTFYFRKSIVLLDDPFSSLDENTAQLIYKNIRESLRDSLVILATHRVNILKNADGIIFLDGSDNIGIKTHEALVKESEDYRRLISLQSEETGGGDKEYE